MPDTAPPAPITTAFWTPNVREQVVATVLDAARPASTAEGRLIAVTDKDRLEAATGAAWVRVAHWTTSGRTGCILRRVANQSIANTTDTASRGAD